MDLQFTYDSQSKIENMGCETWVKKHPKVAKLLIAYLEYVKSKKSKPKNSN